VNNDRLLVLFLLVAFWVVVGLLIWAAVRA